MNLLGEREKGKGHPKISYPRPMAKQFWGPSSDRGNLSVRFVEDMSTLLIEGILKWGVLGGMVEEGIFLALLWAGFWGPLWLKESLKWVTCIKISPKKTKFSGTLFWSRESLSEVCWGQGVLMVSAAAAPPDWSPASSPLKLKIEIWNTNCAHKCLLAVEIENWQTNCTQKCLLTAEI